MENNKDCASVTTRGTEISIALNVLRISTEPKIKAIFSCRNWSVDQGLTYLAGIFKEYCDEDDRCHLTTLEGIDYSEPKDKEIIAAFMERYHLLAFVWNHSGNKEDEYPQRKFFGWVRRHQQICETTWLKDAQEKGLVPESWSRSVSQVSAANTTIKSELGERERASLLQIIAMLSALAYKGHPKHGLLKIIGRDLERAGFQLAPNTVSKHLNAAWALLPSKEN